MQDKSASGARPVHRIMQARIKILGIPVLVVVCGVLG